MLFPLQSDSWLRARRRIDQITAWPRMQRVRRDPAGLVTALQSATNVLVVCHGNIIRSPFAASLMTRLLKGCPWVTVSSAGLEATPGTASPQQAIDVAARLHVDLSRHVASRISADAVARADVVFVMEIAHWTAVRRRFPDARQRTFLLSSLAPGTPLEVEDPFGGTEEEFTTCFNHISSALTPLTTCLAQYARQF
jgi:protein-tyrosine-phosphatase